MEQQRKPYVHVALVLDASGSMERLRTMTIESLKDFFSEMQNEPAAVRMDLWQFNSQIRHLLDSVDIGQGAPETLENYKTKGYTALYDAICTGIDDLGKKFAAMREEDRPVSVIFAILTDGGENSSREYSREDVRKRITHQQEKYSWNFRFLAANQDAVATGDTLGFKAEYCQKFTANDDGIACALLDVTDMCKNICRKAARPDMTDAEFEEVMKKMERITEIPQKKKTRKS